MGARRRAVAQADGRRIWTLAVCRLLMSSVGIITTAPQRTQSTPHIAAGFLLKSNRIHARCNSMKCFAAKAHKRIESYLSSVRKLLELANRAMTNMQLPCDGIGKTFWRADSLRRKPARAAQVLVKLSARLRIVFSKELDNLFVQSYSSHALSS